jgi:TrmH family RNA methyltransferase
MIHIVLIEPENEGNIGAIARSMKNFGLRRLILIDPKADHGSDEARCRAKHAQDILDNTKVRDISFLKNMDYVFGTTAKLGTEYNLPRTPISPERMAAMLNPKQDQAIVLGREGTGLTNNEISMCDMIVSIPTSRRYPVLNLSHAATILFYEIFINKKTAKKSRTPITGHEKQKLLESFDRVLDSMDFNTPEKRQTQKIIWKRLINRAQLMQREAYAVFGFLKKVDLPKRKKRPDDERRKD